MRLFGQDDARTGWDLDYTLQNTYLMDAWEKYLPLCYGPLHIDNFRHAHNLLRPLEFSLIDLHRHIIITPHFPFHEHHPFGSIDGAVHSSKLGTFITAGYQLLPEPEIVYDLNMPSLDYLGAFLEGKHFIINGVAGCYAGIKMIGMLTNNGVMGESAGMQMIGHFTNRGKMGALSAHGMIGCFSNTQSSRSFGQHMLGKNRRSWSIPHKDRVAFLHDITNPEKKSYALLRHDLYGRYG